MNKLITFTLHLCLLFCISFSTSTEIYAQDFPRGCEFDEDLYGSVPKVPIQLTREYGSTPSAYSLKRYCPSIKSQGQQSSCVGWSSTYMARTMLDAIKNDRTSITSITSNSFSPSYIYNQIRLGTACEKGSYITEALKLLTNEGATKLSQFPYSCDRMVQSSDRSKAKSYKIKGYRRLVPSNSVGIVELIKKSISQKKPIVIGMMSYQSFWYTKGVWSGKQDVRTGGHAMTIIGYDDNLYGGSVEIANSWGEKWGNNGFIWVRYSDLIKNTFEFYDMVDAPKPKPKPQPKPVKPDPVKPKPKPEPVTVNALSGKIKLELGNGEQMQATLNSSATRDFNVVRVDKSTYKINESYGEGTQLRVVVSNNEPAYVYILGFGSTSKKVSPLYPFDGYSAYLGYKSNSIAFPNEDYFIELDGTKGKDYLCILYSKEKLDIDALSAQMQGLSGSISTRIKTVLKNKLVEGKDIKFEKSSISFDAKSKDKTVIPIVIEINHI